MVRLGMIVSFRPSSMQMCSNSTSLILVTTRSKPSERPTRLVMMLVWSLPVRQKSTWVRVGAASPRIAGLVPSPCR